LDQLDKEYSDLAFHELVHLLDRYVIKKTAPNPNQKSLLKEKFEREFPEMVVRERKSPQYQKKWGAYLKEFEYLVSDAPDREKAIADLSTQFETTRYGKNFQDMKYVWRLKYDYFHSESEAFAWKAQFSYLKEERGLTFDEAFTHILRLGGTEDSKGYLWTEKLFREWYDSSTELK
jgi:hypothetical protein